MKKIYKLICFLIFISKYILLFIIVAKIQLDQSNF